MCVSVPVRACPWAQVCLCLRGSRGRGRGACCDESQANVRERGQVDLDAMDDFHMKSSTAFLSESNGQLPRCYE